MISLIAVVVILLLHWFADFICQTDEDAKNKSTNNNNLFFHTITYSCIWAVASILFYVQTSITLVLWFAPITFVCHTIQDYITSREVKKYFEKGDLHNGFVIIGFDQFLHTVQLLLTYYFLK